MNGKLDVPVTITIETDGVLKLMAYIMGKVSVKDIVKYRADHNEFYGALHQLEDAVNNIGKQP